VGGIRAAGGLELCEGAACLQREILRLDFDFTTNDHVFPFLPRQRHKAVGNRGIDSPVVDPAATVANMTPPAETATMIGSLIFLALT
jgi:hypothetical protein